MKGDFLVLTTHVWSSDDFVELADCLSLRKLLGDLIYGLIRLCSVGLWHDDIVVDLGVVHRGESCHGLGLTQALLLAILKLKTDITTCVLVVLLIDVPSIHRGLHVPKVDSGVELALFTADLGSFERWQSYIVVSICLRVVLFDPVLHIMHVLLHFGT